jgi:putative transposase
VQTATRVLEVSESGFYEWQKRPPSARSIRHAWLTDMIRQVHAASRGTHGAPRVHAELTMGYGITVGHNAVEMLMRRAGLQGLPGRRRPHRRLMLADIDGACYEASTQRVSRTRIRVRCAQSR